MQCGELGGAQALPQRVAPDHLVSGVRDRGRVAGLQLRFRPCFVDGQPPGVLPFGGGAQHLGVGGEVTEGVVLPQVQRLTVRPGRAARRARAHLGVAAPGQFLEAQGVAFVRGEVQDVAAGTVVQSAEVVGVEHPAQRRDVHLKVLAGRAGRIVRPDGVGQFLQRHRCVRTGEQDRQDKALLQRTERQRQTAAGGSQGAEEGQSQKGGAGAAPAAASAGGLSRGSGFRLPVAGFCEGICEGICHFPRQPLPQPVSSEFWRVNAIPYTKASEERSGGERIRKEP